MGSFTSKSKSNAKSIGSNGGGQISDVDRTMLDLKNARDRLKRYRDRLEKDDAKLLAQAKKAKAEGRKEKALGLLRLRKYKQTQATDCEAQLLNVLQMVETIDSKQNEQQVLQAMAAGKDTLKKMHEETTVEDVLDLMDSIKEEIEVEQEITTILQGVPELSPADEMAVEAELEALQKELAKDNAAAINDTPITEETMPTAPTNELPKHERQELTAESTGRVAVLG